MLCENIARLKPSLRRSYIAEIWRISENLPAEVVEVVLLVIRGVINQLSKY